MLNWLPVKNKDGSINQWYITDSTGKYRISRAQVNGQDKYTAWRGAKAIYCGTSQGAKETAYQDSLLPAPKVSNDVVETAIEEIKTKLRKAKK
jgi:hypothetical protein